MENTFLPRRPAGPSRPTRPLGPLVDIRVKISQSMYIDVRGPCNSKDQEKMKDKELITHIKLWGCLSWK